MKKNIPVLISALLLVLMLTGCMKIDMSVKLNSDETGSVTTQFAITKEAFDYFQELDPDEDPFDGEEYHEIEEDGVTYIAFEESKEDLTFDEIAKFLVEGDKEKDSELTGSDPMFESVKVTKSGGFLGSKYSFVASTIKIEDEADDSADNELGEFGDGLTSLGDSLANILSKFTITIVMPGEISHNSDGLVDGNKVVFTVSDFTEGRTLSVHSKDGINKTYIYFGFCAIFLIAIVIFIIRRLIANKSY